MFSLDLSSKIKHNFFHKITYTNILNILKPYLIHRVPIMYQQPKKYLITFCFHLRIDFFECLHSKHFKAKNEQSCRDSKI